MSDDALITVRGEADIMRARQVGRALAAELGFSSGDQALIATAISELARNIVIYAVEGEVEIETVRAGGRAGISVVARDRGPGIANLDLAMQDGYSTGGGLGLGLPGTRRLMDEFEIQSVLGQGTTITVKKWVR